MNLYIRYKISVLNTDNPSYSLFERWMEAEHKTSSGYSWISFFSNTYQCKWYDHENDMISLSLQYPYLIFLLEGKGEEFNIWRKYFKNGRIQNSKVRITFDDFDESKLVKPKKT